jgi:hydrogenase nickel incorporation protein HypB
MGRFHRHPDGTVHEHEHDHDHRDVGDHSGYADTGSARVAVLESILSENDRVADRNRSDLATHGVRAVNLMSSPGAGKTTLLKRTLVALGEELRVGVLEGDIASSLDADELQGLGAAISLVNTSAGFGGECHLDAVMVRSGLGRLPLDQLDLLLIENVGNLVCPAEFDVGEHAKAMVYAVTEGEEKPLKYPVMFRAADVVLVNKVDLLPHLDVDLDRFLANLHAVNPHATVLQVSARTGEGVDAWCDWLRGVLAEDRSERARTRSASVSMLARLRARTRGPITGARRRCHPFGCSSIVTSVPSGTGRSSKVTVAWMIGRARTSSSSRRCSSMDTHRVRSAIRSGPTPTSWWKAVPGAGQPWSTARIRRAPTSQVG